MNKLNEKITSLREISESKKTTYYELKQVFDTKSHEITEKEYKIKALTTQNDFLTTRLETQMNNMNQAMENLSINNTKINDFDSTIKELTSTIESIESKYDELILRYDEVQEELRNISQLLEGS